MSTGGGIANNTVQILVGNIYQRLSPSNANLDRSGVHKKIHDWILYVDIVAGDEEIIDRVSFDLGASFQPQTFVCQYPVSVERPNNRRAWRFATRQQSYGSVTAGIRIVGVGGSVLDTAHKIVLSSANAKAPLREFRETRPRILSHKMNSVPDRQKIGIELELTSATHILPERVADCLGSRSSTVDVVRDYGVGRNTSDRWKLVPDSSIMCSRSHPDCNKFELVSPILQGGRGLAQTNEILKRMARISPKLSVNKSMGFHVHVDVSNLSCSQIIKICQNFIKYESVMDTFMPPSRRSGSHESTSFFNSNRTSVENGVVNMMYGRTHHRRVTNVTNRECHDFLARDDDKIRLVTDMNAEGRYYRLNLTNLSTGRQPTLEFRQHSATMSYDKVSAWVRFCVAFCTNSARLARPTPFREGRSLEYRFDALFRYVVKDRALCEFYRERRETVAAEEEENGHGCGCRGCGSGGGKCRRVRRRVNL